jgi:hypothetical protein
MEVPANPKIYHVVHVDRLPSIVAEGRLWSDAEIGNRALGGTTIGMSAIKQRRLSELHLDKYPDLHVGECVPFYFCPRSIMLYLIHTGNHEGLSLSGWSRRSCSSGGRSERVCSMGRNTKGNAGPFPCQMPVPGIVKAGMILPI